MKSASPELIAHLNTAQQFRMADCFTLALISGAVLRYTSWDVPVIHGGETFSASGPLIERSRVRVVTGLEVDTLDLTIKPSADDLVAGLPFAAAAAVGAFDGATLQLDRVFLDDDGAVIGGFVHFSGSVADIDITRSEVALQIKSPLELLNIQLPRNLWQPGCLNTLYDDACGLSRASFGVTKTVTSATATSLTAAFSEAAGYFDLGYVLINDGDLAGSRRTIRSYASGVLSLLNPFPALVANGTSITAYPGCDKAQATCSGKFGNLPRFRGMPYVPTPETSL